MDFAERAARNEEVFRGVDERIEEGADQHQVSGTLPFHCECGRASCLETIELHAEEYATIMRERYRFVVSPGHELPEIEKVVERAAEYLIVEKVGEARDQIDRDHPQQHHADQAAAGARRRGWCGQRRAAVRSTRLPGRRELHRSGRLGERVARKP